MSRLNLRSYASSVRVALKIPDSKAQWLGEKLGLSSLIGKYFYRVITFLLVNCGFSEESYKLVSIHFHDYVLHEVSLVLLGGIILAGTFLGYWSARKLVLSEDGSVNSGIAQFVKWTMRSIGIISILQVFSHRWSNKNGSLWPRRSKQAAPPDRRAENLSFAPKGTTRSFWGGSSSYSPSPTAGHSFHSIVAGSGYSLSKRVSRRNQDYYSTYHNVPRRKFSEEEWKRFTRESTSAALTEWASTPEVTKWIGNNAHRLRLIEEDSNVDDTTSEASSDSSKETVPRNESEPSFFAWL
ncbi:hypothetical protein BHM03_00021197 [Ensete ventricosum]|nr:hypothetical protein BHM03_00021197 [Ensete ventricosum]